VTFLSPDSRGRRIRLVPEGTAKDRIGAVDAITGATGTSRGVESILNAAVDRFLKLRRDGQ
ncbi:MAG: FMN-binding protein, partial [Planctomycetota bacterium]